MPIHIAGNLQIQNTHAFTHTLNNINRKQKLSTYNNHSIEKCTRFGAIFQGLNLHKFVFGHLRIYERSKTST